MIDGRVLCAPGRCFAWPPPVRARLENARLGPFRKNPRTSPVGDRAQRLVVNRRFAFRPRTFAYRNVASAARGTRNSNVETYRLYCLDGVGKVVSAEWIEAQGDEVAIRIAGDLHADRSCELWQNSRLVATLDSGRERLNGRQLPGG